MNVKFYTIEQLGPKRHLTPEGFLVCEGVPIARTGVQLYLPSEVPDVEPGPDGYVKVERNPEEVFRPETIASFTGKAIVDEHPDGDNPEIDGFDVNAVNWKKLAVGTVMHLRRGEGVEDDLLLADLLVTDEAAIKKVLAGKIELSCGYSADYEQIERGKGKQVNIIGNHVAIVEQGRCGSRCAIGDSMTTRDKKPSFIDKVRAAFVAKDEKALEETLKEVKDEMTGGGEATPAGGSEESHVHVHLPEQKDDGEAGTPAWAQAIIDGLGRIEAALGAGSESEEAEEVEGTTETDEFPDKKDDDDKKDDKKDTKDKKGKGKDSATVRDSAHLADTFNEVLSLAEILSPGINVPTYDSKALATVTNDSICKFRRRALDRAYGTEDGKEVIESIIGKDVDVPVALKSMTCDAAKMLFMGAAQQMRTINNADTHNFNKGKETKDNKSLTLADINKKNRERFGQPTR